ncbi:MAG: polymer-forming cytoskeletal protein [Gammaproteobacteria bacterium]|nr:polymer-forming cytoskeletal protein [Gammaproteobacteria bacterium]
MMKGTVLDLGTKQNRRTLDRVGGVSTVIGAGSIFKGDLHGKENYVIYGQVEGTSKIDGAVVLEEEGKWVGTIQGTYVIVAGSVEGDVIATEKIELAPTAKITGNVVAPVIAIAEGAVIEGQMKMVGAKEVTHYADQREDDK